MNYKHSSVLICLGTLIFVIVAMITVSYAYFSISANSTNETLEAKAAQVSLTYTDCASSNQSDCANITASLEPGESVTKTFEVANTGTMEASYTVIFKELTNTFTNGELVYKLESLDGKTTYVSQTAVPTSLTTSNQSIYKVSSLAKGTTTSYKMTITFLSKDYDQAANESATFSIKLGIIYE
jgi:hypothetical protein